MRLSISELLPPLPATLEECYKEITHLRHQLYTTNLKLAELIVEREKDGRVVRENTKRLLEENEVLNNKVIQLATCLQTQSLPKPKRKK